jgi:hypothetical protein
MKLCIGFAPPKMALLCRASACLGMGFFTDHHPVRGQVPQLDSSLFHVVFEEVPL